MNYQSRLEGLRIAKECGFHVEEEENGYVATTTLPSHYLTENLPDFLYKTEISVSGKEVRLRSEDPFMMALVADEITESDPFDPENVEGQLSRYPQTLEELSDKLCLSRKTVSSELDKLKDSGFVREEDGIYYHSSWNEDSLPRSLKERSIEASKTMDELDSLLDKSPEGTILEEQLVSLRAKFADKKIFYKALALGGVQNVGK